MIMIITSFYLLSFFTIFNFLQSLSVIVMMTSKPLPGLSTVGPPPLPFVTDNLAILYRPARFHLVMVMMMMIPQRILEYLGKPTHDICTWNK